MNRGQIMLLMVIWFCIWLGDFTDNWVVAGLGFTLFYALLNFLGDLLPQKPEKETDEVPEVRGPKS